MRLMPPRGYRVSVCFLPYIWNSTEFRGSRLALQAYNGWRGAGMNNNSDWQNRLGTIRVAALGVAVVVVGIVWFIRH
jgi:hypothetical protein